MVNTITRLMVRKGRNGDDAVTVPVLDENGVQIVIDGVPQTKKENPKIEVSNCLPDGIEPASLTLEDIVTVAGNLETLATFFINSWDRFRLSQVQASMVPEVDTTYSDFYAAHPEFYAKKFAGLSGDDLAKAKSTFARQVTGASKAFGQSVSDMLEYFASKQ